MLKMKFALCRIGKQYIPVRTATRTATKKLLQAVQECGEQPGHKVATKDSQGDLPKADTWFNGLFFVRLYRVVFPIIFGTKHRIILSCWW
jgi:hypothetical protein